MKRQTPLWFDLSEKTTHLVMEKVARVLEKPPFPLQVQMLPAQAHWFLLDSLLLANRANREGMHANALAITRQCIEAISVIELGLCGSPEAIEILYRWEKDAITAGELRKWLESNLWSKHGSGLWNERWSIFMGNLARAIQPFAHYSSKLSQWQSHIIGHSKGGEGEAHTLVLRFAPRAYDPQKATRITLFHSLITFVLGRIFMTYTTVLDHDFNAAVNRFGAALSQSDYLDGKETDWFKQFWAIVIFSEGPIPKNE
ncbi:MAG: hypothetical protein HZB28_08010 [Methylocystis sp.]|nr:hypothetical protein [Methylocystis sp.]